MTKRTVGDLIEIGPPEGWTHGRHWTGAITPSTLRGAKIAGVSVRDDEITFAVEGVNFGMTHSTFVIEDAELRERIIRAVRPGMDVYEAAAQTV